MSITNKTKELFKLNTKPIFKELFNNVNMINVDGVIYYNLFDIGYNLGYKKWNGKSYETTGEKAYRPYKSRIITLLEKTNVNPLYIRSQPYVMESQVYTICFESNTKLAQQVQDLVIEATVSLVNNGIYIANDATDKDIKNTIKKVGK